MRSPTPRSRRTAVVFEASGPRAPRREHHARARALAGWPTSADDAVAAAATVLLRALAAAPRRGLRARRTGWLRSSPIARSARIALSAYLRRVVRADEAAHAASASGRPTGSSAARARADGTGQVVLGVACAPDDAAARSARLPRHATAPARAAYTLSSSSCIVTGDAGAHRSGPCSRRVERRASRRPRCTLDASHLRRPADRQPQPSQRRRRRAARGARAATACIPRPRRASTSAGSATSSSSVCGRRRHLLLLRAQPRRSRGRARCSCSPTCAAGPPATGRRAESSSSSSSAPSTRRRVRCAEPGASAIRGGACTGTASRCRRAPAVSSR